MTMRRGHEFIHVYHADFAQRFLFPHEYLVGFGPVSADHRQCHRRSSYRFEPDGSICAIYNQKRVDRDAEVIAKNKRPGIEKRMSNEIENVAEIIVKKPSTT